MFVYVLCLTTFCLGRHNAFLLSPFTNNVPIVKMAEEKLAEWQNLLAFTASHEKRNASYTNDVHNLRSKQNYLPSMTY